jgi:hypothetical protein
MLPSGEGTKQSAACPWGNIDVTYRAGGALSTPQPPKRQGRMAAVEGAGDVAPSRRGRHRPDPALHSGGDSAETQARRGGDQEAENG